MKIKDIKNRKLLRTDEYLSHRGKGTLYLMNDFAGLVFRYEPTDNKWFGKSEEGGNEFEVDPLMSNSLVDAISTPILITKEEYKQVG